MLLPILFLFILGTIIGSFLNVVALRLPIGEKMTGRSHCANCGHELAGKDLIPILSFVLLRGRCRYCRKKISRRYLYVELMTGLLFVAAFFISGLQNIAPADWAFISAAELLYLLRILFIISVLIVVFIVDYEHSLILDEVIAPATIVLFVLNIALDFFQQNTWPDTLGLMGLISGFGLFLFFGCLYIFSDGRWMGFGDVKLAWFLGLATVFPGIVLNVFLAFMLGAVVGIGLLLSRKKKLKSEIPFGTFLAISSIITLFYGEQLINSYLHLIGVR